MSVFCAVSLTWKISLDYDFYWQISCGVYIT